MAHVSIASQNFLPSALHRWTKKLGHGAKKKRRRGAALIHTHTSAESIPTLKNRESIYFCLLWRGFVESILYYVYITIHDVK